MKTLTREQYDAFWRDGYLMVEDAVTPSQLAALQAEIAGWVEESRAHQKPFGPPGGQAGKDRELLREVGQAWQEGLAW